MKCKEQKEQTEQNEMKENEMKKEKEEVSISLKPEAQPEAQPGAEALQQGFLSHAWLGTEIATRKQCRCKGCKGCQGLMMSFTHPALIKLIQAVP